MPRRDRVSALLHQAVLRIPYNYFTAEDAEIAKAQHLFRCHPGDSEGSVHSCSGGGDLFAGGLRRAPPDKICLRAVGAFGSIPEIGRRSPRMLPDPKFLHAAHTELLNVGCPIQYSVNPALRPTFKICFRLSLFMI